MIFNVLKVTFGKRRDQKQCCERQRKWKNRKRENKQRELLIVCQKYDDNEVFQIAIKCKFSFNWPKCLKLFTAKLWKNGDAYLGESSALLRNKQL